MFEAFVNLCDLWHFEAFEIWQSFCEKGILENFQGRICLLYIFRAFTKRFKLKEIFFQGKLLSLMPYSTKHQVWWRTGNFCTAKASQKLHWNGSHSCHIFDLLQLSVMRWTYLRAAVLETTSQKQFSRAKKHQLNPRRHLFICFRRLFY